VFTPMLINFSPKRGDRLRGLLEEDQEVLDFPTKILKPIPGLILGLVICSSSPSPLSYPILFLMHPHTLACTHLPIHPNSPHLCLGLEKGKKDC
jgi:hypothetical protein